MIIERPEEGVTLKTGHNRGRVMSLPPWMSAELLAVDGDHLITGKTFEMGDKFKLADLLALELHRFVDDVGEVVDRATKEDKMEQTLAKLANTWKSIEFVFQQHRESDVHLISMKEEDFECLEDNQLVVQGMMASKYLATFEAEVTGWQKKLGNISDVLAQMSEVQRKWAYLETLFIGSEEVKKELPESTKVFEGIDKSFKVCLKKIHDAKNCVLATSGPSSEGQMKTLEVLAKDLEVCEKDLAAFLESKRRIFPRFYFLATNYLLDILSNGNRPWLVMVHINNMLQGIKSMTMTGEPKNVWESSMSNEGEMLHLKHTGKCQLEGKPEKYLQTVVDRVRHEMLAQGGAAIKDYCTEGRKRKDWLFDHIGQLCIVVTQWAWTRDVEIAFDGMGLGNRNAMKEYNLVQVDMMNDLIQTVQSPTLEKMPRRTAMNLITMETHSRDIVL